MPRLRKKTYNGRLVDRLQSSYHSLVGQVVVEKLEQWIRSLIFMETRRNALQWKWCFIVLLTKFGLARFFFDIYWTDDITVMGRFVATRRVVSGLPHCFWGQVVSGWGRASIWSRRRMARVRWKTAWWSRVKVRSPGGSRYDRQSSNEKVEIG